MHSLMEEADVTLPDSDDDDDRRRGGCSSRFNYILIHCHSASASAVCSTVVDLQHLFFPFKKIVKNRTEMVANFDVP